MDTKTEVKSEEGWKEEEVRKLNRLYSLSCAAAECTCVLKRGN